MIEHGVAGPEARYTGHLPRGLAVINGLRVPLDLAGIDSEHVGVAGDRRSPDV